MELTWNKNNKKKKRSREAIASYPNIPFDQQEPYADDTQLQNQESAASQNQEKPLADALDSYFKQLAQSFQAQGNKLAEERLNWNHHGLRAQVNFGEPDSAIESFDRALAIMPDSMEAQDDWKTALHLIKRRKQLQSSGLSTCKNRYMVGDRTKAS